MISIQTNNSHVKRYKDNNRFIYCALKIRVNSKDHGLQLICKQFNQLDCTIYHFVTVTVAANNIANMCVQPSTGCAKSTMDYVHFDLNTFRGNFSWMVLWIIFGKMKNELEKMCNLLNVLMLVYELYIKQIDVRVFFLFNDIFRYNAFTNTKSMFKFSVQALIYKVQSTMSSYRLTKGSLFLNWNNF